MEKLSYKKRKESALLKIQGITGFIKSRMTFKRIKMRVNSRNYIQIESESSHKNSNCLEEQTG